MRFIIIGSVLPEPLATIVCVCHRVSDKTIAHCARSGMGFDDTQLELGVATQCGQCEGCARSLCSECVPRNAVAHLQRQDQIERTIPS